MGKGDSDVRISQRNAQHHFLNVSELSCIGTEKFPPGGNTIKQIAHFNGCANWSGKGDNGLKDAFMCANAQRLMILRTAANDGSVRDTGNGSQRFAPKTQGLNGKKVLNAGNFTGGVTGEGKGKILGRNTAAVIGDTYECFAAVFNSEGQTCRTRINGIFQKFLYHAGRPFHYFSSGDFIYQSVIEHTDWRHGMVSNVSGFQIHKSRFMSAVSPAGRKKMF